MITILLATVPGQPVPQGRPRFSRKVFGHPGAVVAIDPPRSRKWKRQATAILRRVAREAEWSRKAGPMRVRVVAVHQRPAKLAGEERAFHVARGDADNIGKAFLDSATAARIWVDDGQVAMLEVVKVYGRPGEAPRVEILIEALA